MIIKEERIGGQRLILGDCLNVLPLIGEFDCVVTNPPYLLESGGNTTGKMGGKFSKTNYDNSGAIVTTDIEWPDFMPVIFRALRANSHAYIMCNNRHVQNLLNSAETAGLKFHNLLVWNKGTATPNRWYMKNLEFTGFFYKGKAFFINDCGCVQLSKISNPMNQKHPNTKPIELMRLYIGNSTQIGESVIDPFMGSGTTLVACQKLGRKGTGIELEPDYFDIACKRVDEATRQPDLFIAPPEPVPEKGKLL